MSCPNCRSDAREGAAFCGACGSPLERACPACGRRSTAAHRFCEGCGTRIDAGPSGPAPDEGPTTERRAVTVLFADAEGSTAFGERADAEEVFQLVHEAVALMTTAVEAEGGRVTQFLGDGIMALFGAPLSHEDSPRRAVAAALSIQAGLAERSSLRFRVGVHTGPAVVGPVAGGGSRA